MTLDEATKVLQEQCELYRMTLSQLINFIETNPYAVRVITFKAYKVYVKENTNG